MPSRNRSSIEIEQAEARAGVERSEPGGRAQLDAGATRPAGHGRELPDELVDEALARARLRRAGVERLGGEVRDRLSDELIDELLAGARSEAEIVGPGGLLADLTRRLVERAMAAELTEHVGYEPHAEPQIGRASCRERV